jgi:hypothetical protein
MFNSLLAMSVQLSDHDAGAGGFAVVRGSHKINLPMPEAFANGEVETDCMYQPPTKAGDVVFFSEATVHVRGLPLLLLLVGVVGVVEVVEVMLVLVLLVFVVVVVVVVVVTSCCCCYLLQLYLRPHYPYLPDLILSADSGRPAVERRSRTPRRPLPLRSGHARLRPQLLPKLAGGDDGGDECRATERV